MKKIGLGVDDFKKIRERDCLFFDKSLLIRDILCSGDDAFLFLRPRRFGKSFSLSMIKYFFEIDPTGENQKLFHGLKILEDEEMQAHQGQYPVLSITFKGLSSVTKWETAQLSLKKILRSEFIRHEYLALNTSISKFLRDDFKKFLSLDTDIMDYTDSFLLLTQLLEKHHGKPVVVLIDEYDAPINQAYTCGFYKEMIEFMEGFLGNSLKGNLFLFKSICTGVLRIAKESLHSTFNNLTIFSVLHSPFGEYFGFTEEEVKSALEEQEVKISLEDVGRWYNGYQIGDSMVYNPWSVLNLLKYKGTTGFYWLGTGSNKLMGRKLFAAGPEAKMAIQKLMEGETIDKDISQDIAFRSFSNSEDVLWSLLVHTGYLTVTKSDMETGLCTLKIPNKEVARAYEISVMDFFKLDPESNCNFEQTMNYLQEGNLNLFIDHFRDLIANSMSYYDIPNHQPERVYHAFVLGILLSLKDHYIIKSNRESGEGRYDIMMIPRNLNERNRPGIVIEFKQIVRDSDEDLENSAEEALEQIKEKNYAQELLDCGVKKIICLGLAFAGKKVEAQSLILLGTTNLHEAV